MTWKRSGWSVLWMVAGGFALGVALQETGLAKHMIEAIPFSTWPPVLMIVGWTDLLCYGQLYFTHSHRSITRPYSRHCRNQHA
ncbi:hypothetical protein NXY15_09580 [Bacteroides thetaiotaomicron]|nr:hypothetical protein NXY15_09580 [Bacteroides thetaiotaomicron]